MPAREPKYVTETSKGPVRWYAVGEPVTAIPAPESERVAKYRAEVRATMQRFSDQALAYQDARIIGGIDREECDREIMRRASLTREEN